MISHLVLTFIFFSFFTTCSADFPKFIDKLDKGAMNVENTLKSIAKEWDIINFPLFLRSCFMTPKSWELLKSKFKMKILSSEIKKEKSSFKISFLGSSVTAGHDSPFNYSFPVVVGNLMEYSFSTLGIELKTLNLGLGNNPCIPYDICVKYFAGIDADIVHWEQSYNCEGNRHVAEQFIRQALTIPSHPLIVFSESASGHWNPTSCETKKSTQDSKEDKELAKLNPLSQFKSNENIFKSKWAYLEELVYYYEAAGIQTFQHNTHEKYACKGPYTKDFNVGAAPWHPSKLAHRMRAAHHAYFWLMALKEAIQEIRSSLNNNNEYKDIEKTFESLNKKFIEPQKFLKPKYFSPFKDNMKCYTDYEPREIRESSLKQIVLSGLNHFNGSKEGWRHSIYENVVDNSLVKKSKKMGYKDYKHMIFGNNNSGPLSIYLTIDQPGPIFVCETPGIWGKLPNHFIHLYDKDATDFFLNIDVSNKDGFIFNSLDSKKLSFSHDKSLEICVKLKFDDKYEFPSGNHVLTITSKSKKKIIIAWVLTT